MTWWVRFRDQNSRQLWKVPWTIDPHRLLTTADVSWLREYLTEKIELSPRENPVDALRRHGFFVAEAILRPDVEFYRAVSGFYAALEVGA